MSTALPAAASSDGMVTIYAQRVGLTLPQTPVPGLVYCCKLELFSDNELKTPIGTGSATATVIELDLVTPIVQSSLVLTSNGAPAAVTLTALFRRENKYPRSYDAVALGGYGVWTPSADNSQPSAKITAHGPGNGDHLKIELRT